MKKVIISLRWSTKRLNFLMYLDIFGKSLRRLEASFYAEYTVNCVTLCLLYFSRPRETSEHILLWLWTKAAMMSDWGSSTLDIRTAGIVCISYCLCGFVYCTVLILALLTDGRWKIAALYCNTIRCHHCGLTLQTDPGN